ncbi:transposase [Planococcus antarcticus DSM 14505]|uniref:Transposase n=1 Tax=Planococcus antarcticus DSM 14505 TaxID=1185653 RepID=A0ABN4RM54_9BACL|nr:transposase [Planococcus antarcticus DSM 14505]
MIQRQETMNLSSFMEIYDLVVPKDNLLRKINELIDFSFVYEELVTNYYLDNGWNVIHPIRMFKYLLLKSLHRLSDEDLVERARYDLSLKYFLEMAPEDFTIDSSSLTKFRRLRLKDVALLNLLIGKIVEIAIEKGILISKSIIVDATQTKARYN